MKTTIEIDGETILETVKRRTGEFCDNLRGTFKTTSLVLAIDAIYFDKTQS